MYAKWQRLLGSVDYKTASQHRHSSDKLPKTVSRQRALEAEPVMTTSSQRQLHRARKITMHFMVTTTLLIGMSIHR